MACTLACAALAAPVARAAPDADAGATVTLGATLNGLLGSDQQQQQLQELVAQLRSGQAPSGTALAPVQDLLVQLAATPGLPDDVRALVAQVAALLAGAPDGQPLDPGALAPVATLLRDLAGTSGTPSDASALLDRLADLLDGGGGATPGLPVDALSLPPELVAQLRDLLSALENGQQPTGTLLAPVADLLGAVAATPGLPAATSGLLSSLGDAVNGTERELDPLVADQVGTALNSIASTAGLTPGQQTTIERISTLIVRSSGGASAPRARTATKRDRAVIKRIRVNRARTRVGVRIACPRSAPRACATTVTAKLAGRKAARGKHVRIGAGRSKVVRLRLTRTARAASADHGARLRVRVVTAFGTQRFASAKTATVKARHR